MTTVDFNEETAQILEQMGVERGSFHAHGVPEHLRSELALYVARRVKPGGFLMARLENNLTEALGRASSTSRDGLFAVVAWLFNEAPAPCWGLARGGEDVAGGQRP